MYICDLNDAMFLSNQLKFPSDKYNIIDYVKLTSGAIRSALRSKAETYVSLSLQTMWWLHLSYAYGLWNSIPLIVLSPHT